MHCYDLYESPHGRMLLVANAEGLSGVYFDGQKYLPKVDPEWRRDARHAPLRQTKRELAEYFGGERERFETALAPEGTPFQRSVWKAISTVGFGKTITYADLARRAGYPGSARAAGAATGRNPISIIVPCHRIGRQPDRLCGRARSKARAARARVGNSGLAGCRLRSAPTRGLESASDLYFEAVVVGWRRISAATGDFEVASLSGSHAARNVRGVLIHELALLEQLDFDLKPARRTRARVLQRTDNRDALVALLFLDIRQHNVLARCIRGAIDVRVRSGAALILIHPVGLSNESGSDRGDREAETQEETADDR
jgi:methylated-DNA-[protein]-cysteine S-methyltransferase